MSLFYLTDAFHTEIAKALGSYYQQQTSMKNHNGIATLFLKLNQEELLVLFWFRNMSRNIGIL